MENSLKKIFGSNLAALMKQRKTKQKELSDALDVSQSVVSSWINGGKFPRDQQIEGVARFYNVPIAELFASEGDSKVFNSSDMAQIAGEAEAISRTASSIYQRASRLAAQPGRDSNFGQDAVELLKAAENAVDQQTSPPGSSAGKPTSNPGQKPLRRTFRHSKKKT